MKSFFISSTFSDMQAERDILHQRVFPRIRKQLEQYGEDIEGLDLRWGVDTSNMSEEESGKHVVKMCIDTIDRCKPYMIILIGERYGWVPDQKVVDEIQDERLSELYRENLSITQMEILYGALKEPKNLKHCIFCFRNSEVINSIPEEKRRFYDAESEEHRIRLQKFKEQIKKTPDVIVMEYSGEWSAKSQKIVALDTFARDVEEKINELLKADLNIGETEQTIEQRIILNAKAEREQHLKYYVDRYKLEELGALALLRRQIFCFFGDEGCGKTMLLSRISELQEACGIRTLLYYCKNEGCNDVKTFQSVFEYWMERQQGENKMVLIDGVEHLKGDVEHLIAWLSWYITEYNKEKIRFSVVISASREMAVMLNRKISNLMSYAIKDLEESKIESIAQKHAARRGKKLDMAVLRRIRKNPNAKNPYGLSLLMQKLFMLNQKDFEVAEQLSHGMTGITEYMCQLVEKVSGNIEILAENVILDAFDKIADYQECSNLAIDGKRTAEPTEMMEILSVSAGGMKIEELQEYLDLRQAYVPRIILEELLYYLYDFFDEDESGRWNFKHTLNREYFWKNMSEEERKSYEKDFLNYYEHKGKAFSGLQLYYAWKSEDVSAGIRALENAKEDKTGKSEEVFWEMVQDRSYLSEIVGQATGAMLENMYEIILKNPDEIAKNYRMIRYVALQRLPDECASENEKRLYDRMQSIMEIYEKNYVAYLWKDSEEQTDQKICRADGYLDEKNTDEGYKLYRELLTECERNYWFQDNVKSYVQYAYCLWGMCSLVKKEYQEKYISKALEVQKEAVEKYDIQIVRYNFLCICLQYVNIQKGKKSDRELLRELDGCLEYIDKVKKCGKEFGVEKLPDVVYLLETDAKIERIKLRSKKAIWGNQKLQKQDLDDVYNFYMKIKEEEFRNISNLRWICRYAMEYYTYRYEKESTLLWMNRLKEIEKEIVIVRADKWQMFYQTDNLLFAAGAMIWFEETEKADLIFQKYQKIMQELSEEWILEHKKRSYEKIKKEELFIQIHLAAREGKTDQLKGLLTQLYEKIRLTEGGFLMEGKNLVKIEEIQPEEKIKSEEEIYQILKYAEVGILMVEQGMDVSVIACTDWLYDDILRKHTPHEEIQLRPVIEKQLYRQYEIYKTSELPVKLKFILSELCVRKKQPEAGNTEGMEGLEIKNPEILTRLVVDGKGGVTELVKECMYNIPLEESIREAVKERGNPQDYIKLTFRLGMLYCNQGKYKECLDILGETAHTETLSLNEKLIFRIKEYMHKYKDVIESDKISNYIASGLLYALKIKEGKENLDRLALRAYLKKSLLYVELDKPLGSKYFVTICRIIGKHLIQMDEKEHVDLKVMLKDMQLQEKLYTEMYLSDSEKNSWEWIRRLMQMNMKYGQIRYEMGEKKRGVSSKISCFVWISQLETEQLAYLTDTYISELEHLEKLWEEQPEILEDDQKNWLCLFRAVADIYLKRYDTASKEKKQIYKKKILDNSRRCRNWLKKEDTGIGKEWRINKTADSYDMDREILVKSKLECDETEWVNSYLSVLDKQFKEACLYGMEEYKKGILQSQLEELYDLDMHSEKAQIQIEHEISEIIEEQCKNDIPLMYYIVQAVKKS